MKLLIWLISLYLIVWPFQIGNGVNSFGLIWSLLAPDLEVLQAHITIFFLVIVQVATLKFVLSKVLNFAVPSNDPNMILQQNK